jgi:hypothetical protein
MLMEFGDFLERFGRTARPTMNMSIYRDSFVCGCGDVHWFDDRIDIICEGLMKVMVHCPVDSTYVNSLKIKTFMLFKFKGFENQGATRITNEVEVAAYAMLRSLVRMH